MKYEKMNKRNMAIFNQYLRSTNISLSDVYVRFSDAKQAAYDYCIRLYLEKCGSNYRIISYNFNVFSFGFTFEENGKKYFAYITRDYDRAIEIPKYML